jgi:hypothetical protein
MTYGFKIITGEGAVVVYDSDTPAPGYILEEFTVDANATVTKNYSESGMSELIPYVYPIANINNNQARGFPQVTINGLSITITNIHYYSSYGWGGPVYALILGR